MAMLYSGINKIRGSHFSCIVNISNLRFVEHILSNVIYYELLNKHVL